MSDYKSRNPVAPTWTREAFSSWRTPEPYDVLTGADAFETDTPDLSAVLLMKVGSIGPKNDSITFFGIEAFPRHH